jgi:hypothetical protein
LITSCGSYQNSSYYGDGIYGDQGNKYTNELLRIVITDSGYFSSLQNDNQSTEIFTDIDQYNDYQGTNDNNQGIDGNYGAATILKLTLPFIRLISMLDGD